MRTTTRRATIVAAVVLASCGGSSGPTAEAFVDDLEDICRDLVDDLDALGEPADLAELAVLASDARDIYEEYLDQMKALEAPEELRADFDDFVDLVEQGSDLLRDMRRAADGGDEQAVSDLIAEADGLRADRNALAEDLGADRCVADDESDTPTTDAPTSDAPTSDSTVADTVTPTTVVAPTTAVTAPPISQVPITSPTTIAVDPQGIGTIDIVGGFNPPGGFQFQDPGVDTLQTIKDAYAQTPSLASAVSSVGTAYIVDETNTISAVMFLTFWSSDIAGTPTQDAFELEFTATAATSSDQVTPAGLEHVLYVDPDGQVGLVATANNVSLWLLVDAGQEEFVQLLADDFLAANTD